MATSRPQALGEALPAAIAYDLQHVPETTVLALLGMGVIASDGAATDAVVAGNYALLADEADPCKVIRKYYRDVEAAHGWFGKHTRVLTDPIKRPGPNAVEGVREACLWLSRRAFSRLEELAEGDLLGRVDMEMVHQRHRRKGVPGTYAPMDHGQLMAELTQQPVRNGMNFEDLWAGSGFRAIGFAMYMRAKGYDPQTVSWKLHEADALHRAIVAINCLAFEIGDKIEILDGTAYRSAAIAAYNNGMAPGSWYIPKEVAKRAGYFRSDEDHSGTVKIKGQR